MKKEFDVKYKLKDEVYFLYNNEIIRDKIIKYRISVEEPFSISHDNEFTEHSGITVEYFFIILKNNINFLKSGIKEIDMKKDNFDFVWINQNDVHETEEELMKTL